MESSLETPLRVKLGSWLLSTWGIANLAFCLLVLGFVATSPDIGLRCLLIDDRPDPSKAGIKVELVTGGARALGELPRAGDVLLSISREPVGTFMHFTRRLMALRDPVVPPGGSLYPGAKPQEQGELLPPIVELDGQRWVEIEYERQDTAAREKCWLLVHSLPLSEVVMSFVWFILEFGIFMVGALAFWTRPFDRPARTFFAMCVVTVAAYVGGYHWWLIAASLWLSIPFMISAMLVPVVTLHFFLVYPQPRQPALQYPRATVVALYALPLLCTFGLCGLTVYSFWLYRGGASNESIRAVMQLLNDGIYAYLLVAAAYFAATIVALLSSFATTTRNPLVHSQVKWILCAGILAILPIGYTLYLARFYKVEFSLGEASLPMFTASLLFMLAYAVGIVRFKLMLLEEVLSRGMTYYVVSFLATAVFSLLIAASSLMGMYQNMHITQQAASVVTTVLVAVILLGWFRDRVQQLIDRRFFREKYQLDKALQRMNQAVGHLVEANTLAERMLTSCRDVLGVDRAVLYLREGSRDAFQLVASDGSGTVPRQVPATQELLGILREDLSLQKQGAELLDNPSPARLLFRDLNIDLVHALEVDGDLAGLVLLGPKRNGAQYSAEDLTFLTALGQITSVALHGAKVQQAVGRLNEELRLKVDKIAEQQRMISMLQTEITGRQETTLASEPEPFRRDLIKGNSSAIRTVLETVRKVSHSQSSVLIRGESGTGKELLAQAIHENSPRRAGPMVSVHCGALSPGLLESELFGHVKGSFTGAHRDRVGRFELANGGSLFLDEIGDISLETQIKLLRVLQERTFEPVGGTRTVQVDVRLIAATHQNLEKLISEGKFREDLFYRLNVISITLPALRERADDIFELALYFLGRAARRVGKSITHLEDDAVQALQHYPWPGNIRELENAVERAVVLAEGPHITLGDLPPQFANIRATAPRPVEEKPALVPITIGTARESHTFFASIDKVTSRQDVAEVERLLTALKRCHGNKAEAARLLGLPRSTYFSKLKKYNIDL